MKKLLLGVLFVFALCVGFMVKPAEVSAAEKFGTNVWGMNTYSDDDKYSADLDKDKKTDKVETVIKTKTNTIVDEDGFEYNETEYISTVLKINGKQFFKWTVADGKYGEVYIMKMDDGKYYLSIVTTTSSEDTFNQKYTGGIYKYSKDTLTKVFSYDDMITKSLLIKDKFGFTYNNDAGNGTTEFYPEKSSKGTVYYGGCIFTKALGNVSIHNLKVTYSKGKFSTSTAAASATVRNMTSSGKVDLNSTAKVAIKAKKSVGSTKTKFTIKAGKKFKVTNLVIKKKALWVKVKYGSKTGYVKLGKSKLVKAFGVLIYG